MALRVAGVSATQASGALTQMGQLLGSSRVQAEEFNSINEGARPILMAVAQGLDEAGGSVSKLKQLVTDGKVSGEQFFQAFLRGLPKIEGMAANATQTIEQGVIKVTNAFTKYIGETDESLSASQRLVAGLNAIADNFENVADVALKVAAIFAAGMLGRSIGGMVRNLSLAAGALTRFAAAARAATTVAGLATAIGGLSAAAGPIGALMGVAIAGGLVAAGEAARDAEDRTQRLRTEMEQLGLYVPEAAGKAAGAADRIGEAIDQMASKDRIDRIRDLRAELAGIDGDMGLLQIETTAGRGAGPFGFLGDFEKSDKPVLARIREIARALRDAEMTSQEAMAEIAKLEHANISEPAQELLDRLKDLSGYRGAIDLALTAEGGSAALQQANEELDLLLDRLHRMGDVGHLDAKIVAEIDNIIDSMGESEDAAADAQRALIDLGNANPSFAGAISAIAGVIGRLAALRAEAAAARAAVAAVGGGGMADSHIQAYSAHQAALEETRKANEEYIAEQRRINSLSGEQLALEKEMGRVRKENANLSDEQVRMLAQERLAAEARRSAEGRASRSKGGGQSRKAKQEPGLFEDSADEIRDLEREISLIGKSTEEVARLRAQWALLDEVKRRGVPVTDDLNIQIEAQAAQVGQLTAQLERAEQAQEQFDQAIDGVADAFAGALLAGESLRDGLAQVFKQIAADIINSGIRNALMGQLGGGGGFLGGLAQSIFGGGDRLTGALRLAGLPARANGGPVQAGQMYMTGEKGPEPFVPAVNGRILSVAQAQAALRGRSGGINATFAPNISIAPGVTQAELGMTMAAARQEYERNFLPMLQKHLPSYNERYA